MLVFAGEQSAVGIITGPVQSHMLTDGRDQLVGGIDG